MDREDRVETTPKKLFFSIGEVSKIAGLPPYVLRFWESEFKELRPQKSRGGHRRYRKEDVELLLRIKNLLYQDKFTIKGAREELEKEKKKGKNSLDLSIIKEGLEEILKILD
ncbi:MAG: MerR family transcriptional regulator [Candidatus Aerophobetes bacterium]|nr:MerR family transcriptional regulator [Candidatus Aerophobetes bacterium]